MLAAKYFNVPARDFHRKAKKPTNFDKLLYFKRLYSKSEHLKILKVFELFLENSISPYFPNFL